MSSHNHHHHHHHGHGEDKTLGEHNKEHFDDVASHIFDTPWIVELSNQIFQELQESVEWIGFSKNGSQNTASSTKMLDYACGDGLASRALAPYISQVRGMDISSGMVDQYNLRATKEGFSPEKMHAAHGDLTSTATTSDTNTPEFNNFDLVVMSMALHHVEDPSAMIQSLTGRLSDGGVLLIVDWVAGSESGCLKPEWEGGAVSHTISQMGFTEGEVKGWFGKAGMENWGWKWFSERSKMPEEFGEQQLFLARGEKKRG